MTNTYENDCWELYFDGDNSKGNGGTAYDGINDCQIRIEWGKDLAAADIDVGGGVAAPDVVAAVQANAEIAQLDFEDGSGWYLEFSIPLDAIQLPGVIGTEFGFETQGNDNDGTARDHITKWWLQSGDFSWNNASVFGTAVLLDAIVTGVDKIDRPIPTEYSLQQNYPNPFNPSTKINFSIVEPGMVSLKVYNLLGQEVATLVNEELNTGAFEVNFNAANLTSGTYFYKLQTQNTSLTKKMIVLK